MTLDDMQDALNLLDEDLIQNVAHLRKKKNKRKMWVKWIPLVACLCCFFVIVLSAKEWFGIQNENAKDYIEKNEQITEAHQPEIGQTVETNPEKLTNTIRDVMSNDGKKPSESSKDTTCETVQESNVHCTTEEEYVEEMTNESVESFSYEEVKSLLAEDTEFDGILYEGFQNTEEIEVNHKSTAVQLAILECTVEYNQIKVAYDETTDMWCVSFSTKGMAGGDQTVYLNGNGITQLIVYGE